VNGAVSSLINVGRRATATSSSLPPASRNGWRFNKARSSLTVSTQSYCQLGIIAWVTKSEIGLILAKARHRSGKTQAELARVMGTTQPVIARAEAGYRMPTLDFIDRWARGTGVPIVLKLGQTRPGMPAAATRRALVRSVLGRGRFNPWDRNPAPVEAALLEEAGLTREHFERMRGQRGKRS
jgi:transcriptional regulator with XRE-family HTH domain